MSAPAKLEPGVRKAAVLLMSLDEDDAAAMMGRLPAGYVEKVSIAIAQLDVISGREQESIMNEFLQSRASVIGPNSGGLERAKNLVKKALGKSAGDTLSVLQQTMEAIQKLYTDAKLVHGDLSEYNIMVCPSYFMNPSYDASQKDVDSSLQVVLIDFGQAVDWRHPDAMDLLTSRLRKTKTNAEFLMGLSPGKI